MVSVETVKKIVFSMKWSDPTTISVKPRLSADFCYRPSAHRLSTTILRTFTRLYGEIYKGDAEFRLCSKTGSEVLDPFEDTR